MGIKKKIIIGFILIGILLLMSGILTSVELSKLNGNIATKIKDHEDTFYLSKQLIEAAQQNNMAILSSLSDSLDIYDSILNLSLSNFDKVLLQLKHKNPSDIYLERVEAAYHRYEDVLNDHSQNRSFKWFVDVYAHAHSRLIYSIKEYLMLEQDDLLNQTSVLEYNMYRSLMIGVIAFSSAILLLIAFYFMIKLFFLSPVLKMQKSLRDYLKANIPYDVKIETTDEIQVLSSDIAELCSKSKKDFEK